MVETAWAMPVRGKRMDVLDWMEKGSLPLSSRAPTTPLFRYGLSVVSKANSRGRSGPEMEAKAEGQFSEGSISKTGPPNHQEQKEKICPSHK